MKVSYAVATAIFLGVAGYASASPFRTVADTQVPTVSIVSPAAGATVSNTLTVSGTAADNVQTSKVELKVDSGSYTLATGTSTWSLVHRHKRLRQRQPHPPGRATDSSGNQAWASRTVTVSNGRRHAGADGLDREPGRRRDGSGNTSTVSGSAADNVQVVEGRAARGRGSYQLASGTSSWSLSHRHKRLRQAAATR